MMMAFPLFCCISTVHVCVMQALKYCNPFAQQQVLIQEDQRKLCQADKILLA